MRWSRSAAAASTLFPPTATADLYVGPFNNTLAGQPVSMPDPLRPDLAAYPRFAQALESALSAELGPGDAVFIPALWWHHVAALGAVNVLVNYWYNDVAHGGPFVAFIHALAAIRDLPESQRTGWHAWFEHFIFAPGAADAASHLPAGAQGVNGPASPGADRNDPPVRATHARLRAIRGRPLRNGRCACFIRRM